MIIAAAVILGALLGDMRARKAGGDTLDRLQYAASHAIVFAILGLFATVLIDRAARG